MDSSAPRRGRGQAGVVSRVDVVGGWAVVPGSMAIDLGGAVLVVALASSGGYRNRGAGSCPGHIHCALDALSGRGQGPAGGSPPRNSPGADCLAVGMGGLGGDSRWTCTAGPSVWGWRMDLVTLGAVVLAVVTGASEALGGQLLERLSSLVKRPSRRQAAAGGQPVSSGEPELAALRQDPGDQRTAVALAEVLLARASDDSEFGQALDSGGRKPNQCGPARVRSPIRSAAASSTGRCCKAGTSPT